MKPDWKAELKTLKKEVIKDHEGKSFTLEALAYGLLTLHDPKSELSGGAKLKNGRLAARILEGEDITIDEAQVIRDLVGKYGTVNEVCAVEELLDPKKEIKE